MAQPYAGPGYGSHAPQHKGTEVLVVHVDGDLTQAIIINRRSQRRRRDLSPGRTRHSPSRRRRAGSASKPKTRNQPDSPTRYAMPNDAVFPVTSHTEGQGAQKHRVLQSQLDRSRSTPWRPSSRRARVHQVDGVSRPATSTPTKGPHRYTIFVPHNDESRRSTSATGPQAAKPSFARHQVAHPLEHAFRGERTRRLPSAWRSDLRTSAGRTARHHRFFAQYQRARRPGSPTSRCHSPPRRRAWH